MYDRGDDFWDALADVLGEVAIPGEIRALLAREKGFSSAMDVWRAGDASERSKTMLLLRTIARPALGAAGMRSGDAWQSQDAVPPAWWNAYSQSVFALFRDEQRQALNLLGVGRPVAVADLDRVIGAKRVTERVAGDRLTLQYPVASPLGAVGLPVYGGEDDAGIPTDEFEAEARIDAVLSPYVDAMTEEDRGWYMRGLIGWLRRSRGMVDSRQSLARIASLQDAVAKETGCRPWEATAFLLCDIVPDLPFVRIERLQDWFLEHRPAGDNPIRITVGSPKVPASAVAAAYSKYLADDTSRPERLRRSRSAAPLIAADFVRDYRQRVAAEGRSASWTEMWEAFRTLHPDAYGSLKSFRQTVYRQLGPSRKSGQP